MPLVRRQHGEEFGDLARQRGVIQADIGVVDRRRSLQLVLAAVAPDQHAHQVGQVLVRPGQPVLQPQEIRPHVLSGARDEAHQLGQAAQHLHLRLAIGRGAIGLLGAAQLLQHRQRAGGFFHHVEAAEPGQPGDFAGGHAAQHRVAMVAPGCQGGLDRADVVFHEQHRGDHHVAAANVLNALGQRRLVAAPLVGGVNHQRQARQLRPQHRLGPGGGAGQMAVHRHHDDSDRLDQREDVIGHPGPGRAIGHNGLLHHTACPP